MLKKDKIFVSNIVFFLTACLAVGILILKTNTESHMGSSISYVDFLTLFSPIIFIVIFMGIINFVIGLMIVYRPLWIPINKVECSS